MVTIKIINSKIEALGNLLTDTSIWTLNREVRLLQTDHYRIVGGTDGLKVPLKYGSAGKYPIGSYVVKIESNHSNNGWTVIDTQNYDGNVANKVEYADSDVVGDYTIKYRAAVYKDGNLLGYSNVLTIESVIVMH
jgi:hypothetical protein